jgi:hypothetical protein
MDDTTPISRLLYHSTKLYDDIKKANEKAAAEAAAASGRKITFRTR